MNKILTTLTTLLIASAATVQAQHIERRCGTCGKTLTACPYNGKHVKTSPGHSAPAGSRNGTKEALSASDRATLNKMAARPFAASAEEWKGISYTRLLQKYKCHEFTSNDNYPGLEVRKEENSQWPVSFGGTAVKNANVIFSRDGTMTIYYDYEFYDLSADLPLAHAITRHLGLLPREQSGLLALLGDAGSQTPYFRIAEKDGWVIMLHANVNHFISLSFTCRQYFPARGLPY